MSTAKALAVVKRTKEYKQLIASGLRLVSTERQLENGTLAFAGKFKVGKAVVRPDYKVTAAGNIISNYNIIRNVKCFAGTTAYRSGLKQIAEGMSKRLAA